MEYIDWLCLACFWTGILLITVKKKPDLKERALYYLTRYYGEENTRKAKEFIEKTKRKLRQEKLEKELSESLAVIRNLVVLGRGNISAELLLTELSEGAGLLSPVYLDMAHWLHLNEKERAAKVFASKFDGSCAIEIGRFLAGWEDVDPSELLSSVELYQSALREERSTRQQKTDETVSDLIYFPVVLNCMAVLLNFIYVAYFVGQRESLNLLIG